MHTDQSRKWCHTLTCVPICQEPGGVAIRHTEQLLSFFHWAVQRTRGQCPRLSGQELHLLKALAALQSKNCQPRLQPGEGMQKHCTSPGHSLASPSPRLSDAAHPPPGARGRARGAAAEDCVRRWAFGLAGGGGRGRSLSAPGTASSSPAPAHVSAVD